MADHDQGGRRSPRKWLKLLLVFAGAFLGAAFLRLCGILDGLTVDMLLFYLNTAQGESANYSAVTSAVRACLPWGLAGGGAALLLYLWSNPLALAGQGTRRVLFPIRWMGRVAAGVSAILLAAGLCAVLVTVQAPQYVASRLNKTTIYEDYYADPRSADITWGEDAHNLIHIVLESGEASCLTRDAGGSWDYELIPNLTGLKEENVSFSDFVDCRGTAWTIAGLVSQTSGLPLKVPTGGNSYGETSSTFFPNVYTLGDILRDAGYRQVFLCGSDAEFAGRGHYYEQHGGFEVVDIDEAKRRGMLPEDYSVFWGYEDEKLYQFAKEELLSLAGAGEPFNLTMLTVDTHFPDGYLCRLCGSGYGTKYENVLACADSQVGEFVRWIQRQDFFEDTTIVITGDHLFMDHSFYRDHGVEDGDRRVYNCILNPAVDTEGLQTRRRFTSFDVFPTIVSALGGRWEGDRLGLGVDLFSGTPTLVEEMGSDALNGEMVKSSDYYNRRFLYGEDGL